jgi:CheY-like chemotaxis protein
LVDDDEAHLLVTELSLKDEYIVFRVNSGEEVLEFLNKSDSLQKAELQKTASL